jgi:hypothetical protein
VRASAYLTIFDDWDLLGPAIESVYDRVDEIVVVDGAYRWMAPVFTALGRDPTKSCPEVYRALAPFAAKLRVVTGLWSNEVEKRIAGFKACRNRYVYRVDADEVLFFDDAEIGRFIASGLGVAEMEMPIALAPDLIRATRGARIERQCLLFDSEQISADAHCDYLWLVLTAAEREALPPKRPELFYAEPIAFNVHLTHWRKPNTARNRARFYIMNSMREHRSTDWFAISPPDENGDDADWFAAVFERFPAGRLTELFWGEQNTLGWTGLQHFGVRPMPLSVARKAAFAGLFDAQMSGLAELNRGMSHSTTTMRTERPFLIDLSTVATRQALGRGSRVAFLFDEPLAGVATHTMWMCADPPCTRTAPVAGRGLDTVLVLDVPIAPAPGSFRHVLSLSVQCKSGAPFVSFKIDT